MRTRQQCALRPRGTVILTGFSLVTGVTHHDELEFLAALPGILAAHDVADVVRRARSFVDVLRGCNHKLLDIVSDRTLDEIGHLR